MAIKISLSLMANSILIPFVINRYVKLNVFGQGGLVDEVFILSLYSLFFDPLLKAFNLKFYLTRLWYKYNKPLNIL